MWLFVGRGRDGEFELSVKTAVWAMWIKLAFVIFVNQCGTEEYTLVWPLSEHIYISIIYLILII